MICKKEYRKSKYKKNIKKNIFISCEGKTEKTYFNSLNYIYDNIHIIAKHNQKTSAIDVVQNFNDLFKNEDISNDDLKFCAFDKDKNNASQLIDAKKIANAKKIKILFSNPCFEIWLYWHFEAKRRETNSKILKDYMSYKDGFSNYSNDIFLAKKLEKYLGNAITVAKNARLEYKRNDIDTYVGNSNPYTDIDKFINLISEI